MVSTELEVHTKRRTMAHISVDLSWTVATRGEGLGNTRCIYPRHLVCELFWLLLVHITRSLSWKVCSFECISLNQCPSSTQYGHFPRCVASIAMSLVRNDISDELWFVIGRCIYGDAISAVISTLICPNMNVQSKPLAVIKW